MPFHGHRHGGLSSHRGWLLSGWEGRREGGREGGKEVGEGGREGGREGGEGGKGRGRGGGEGEGVRERGRKKKREVTYSLYSTALPAFTFTHYPKGVHSTN